MAETVIELRQVERHYLQGQKKLTILSGTDFSLSRGEMVALVAPCLLYTSPSPRD